MYKRKTRDAYYLQGNYAGEWEDLFECENGKDAREQLRCYNENESEYPHRIVKRRIKL